MFRSFLVLSLLVTFGFSLVSCTPVNQVQKENQKNNEKEEIELKELISRYPEVSFEDLKRIVSLKTAVIVDANSLEQYESGHIPTAINFSKIASNLAGNLPENKDAQLIAYCGGPQCLSWLGAAQAMRKLGYTNVKHYKGGLKGWKEAGGKLVK